MLLKNELVCFCVTQINKCTHVLDFTCLPRNGVMSSNPRKYNKNFSQNHVCWKIKRVTADWKKWIFLLSLQTNIYQFKVSNRNTREMCEIYSKAKNRLQNNTINVVLMSSLLNVNIFQTFFACFHCWRWAGRRLLSTPSANKHSEASGVIIPKYSLRSKPTKVIWFKYLKTLR